MHDFMEEVGDDGLYSYNLQVIKEGEEEGEEEQEQKHGRLRGPSVFSTFVNRIRGKSRGDNNNNNNHIQHRRSTSTIDSAMNNVAESFDRNSSPTLSIFDEEEEKENLLQEISQYCIPVLTDLTLSSLRQFRLNLAQSEEIRCDINAECTEDEKMIPLPTPTQLIARNLWSTVLMEIQKINPNVTYFDEITFDDLGNWLIRTVVPQPNNRSFLKRIQVDFRNLLTTFCIPIPSSNSWNKEDEKQLNPYYELFDNEKQIRKRSKKFSSTSTVSSKSSGVTNSSICFD